VFNDTKKFGRLEERVGGRGRPQMGDAWKEIEKKKEEDPKQEF
jgi:hypothetical protein